jgi:hypothetical protein
MDLPVDYKNEDKLKVDRVDRVVNQGDLQETTLKQQNWDPIIATNTRIIEDMKQLTDVQQYINDITTNKREPISQEEKFDLINIFKHMKFNNDKLNVHLFLCCCTFKIVNFVSRILIPDIDNHIQNFGSLGIQTYADNLNDVSYIIKNMKLEQIRKYMEDMKCNIPDNINNMELEQIKTYVEKCANYYEFTCVYRMRNPTKAFNAIKVTDFNANIYKQPLDELFSHSHSCQINIYANFKVIRCYEKYRIINIEFVNSTISFNNHYYFIKDHNYTPFLHFLVNDNLTVELNEEDSTFTISGMFLPNIILIPILKKIENLTGINLNNDIPNVIEILNNSDTNIRQPITEESPLFTCKQIGDAELLHSVKLIDIELNTWIN